MQHGGIKIQTIGEREFCEARAAIEGAPVRQSGDTLPAILRGKRRDIHPIARRHVTVGSTLFVNFRVKFIARAEIPGYAM